MARTCQHVMADTTAPVLQSEKGSREATLRDGQRWLDQAQGQLQNTQVALNDKEAECRELATYYEEAAQQAHFFEVNVVFNTPPAASLAVLIFFVSHTYWLAPPGWVGNFCNGAQIWLL